ncbi:MAG TPA: response regulator [Anaerolineales bacterium]|nr:response regulator [Anaerolineales bacterium]
MNSDNQFFNRKILIVEDERRMARFIRLNLEHDGFRVLEAVQGQEGLDKLREELPDLILLDSRTRLFLRDLQSTNGWQYR